MYVLMLKISHRPDVRLMFCPLFAGRRCLCPVWHSHDNVFLDHRQHSLLCACSCSKVPIAPMGIPADLPNRLSSFNWDRSLVLYQGGVRASHACKLPIAPMGALLTCPNRLSSNRDMYVPATPANFPSPPCGEEILVPTLHQSDHCDLSSPTPHPVDQCLCLWRHCLHLGNDPPPPPA
jgi:hypothetical protein